MIDDSTPALDPRHRQVHRLPPLRHGVQRGPGSGRPVRPGPRLRHPDRPGVRPEPERRRLRAVRPVRGRLPRRRHPGAQPDRRGLGRARRPDQDGDRPDRAGHPRRPRRVLRLRRPARWSPARWSPPCAASASTPCSTPTSPPTSPSWRKAPSCSCGSRRRSSTARQVALPQFSSCSPGWINYMEHFNPDMLDNLSTCKSPQQMFGALAKTYYAEKIGVKPEDMVVVSVMPCTAKKYEAARPEMNDSGVQDVDIVLTTRELGAHDQAGRHRLPQPARREDGRAAGHQHRRRRHLRRHRRRHGGGPAHGVGDRHRDAVPLPEPARRAHRGPRRRQGRDRQGRGRQGRLGVPRGRRPQGRRGLTGSATRRRSSTRSRAARPSTTSSRS